ncbi:uncharacterized protein NPIL_282371 [Nephila pilipes]|uniref:Integrase catalytic domain-containing protein n=1 Tax=Nephila pilipes TaxID=299642 RepID=A0A8X6PHL4_NEPPI|nr:uncharacterized protein NPIL_282371 [Nephila pilipes]
MKQRYWIVGAKTAVRWEVRRCVTCARFSSEFSKEIIAYLPAARGNPGREFLKGGRDFAGPFFIPSRHGKGVKALKLHVCVFVCFTTKAIHLEMVSDLSAQTCIAALKRFIARRRKPKEIFSDCGTNFFDTKNFLRSWELETVII